LPVRSAKSANRVPLKTLETPEKSDEPMISRLFMGSARESRPLKPLKPSVFILINRNLPHWVVLL